MRCQQQGAVVLRQQSFQQFQGFRVEIVRRLVEDQEIGRLREQPRQQQAVALAAGQGLDRRPDALLREQEIRQVADHVMRLAGHYDLIAAVRAEGFPQGGLGVQLGAPLVEIDLRQPGAEAQASGVRRQFAHEDVDERRFADAVRPDQADAVAAHDAGREIAHHRVIAEGFGDALGLDDHLAGTRTAPEGEVDLSRHLAALSPFLAHGHQAAHAALVAGAAGAHALANPDLLLRQAFVELRGLGPFDRQQGVLVLAVGRPVGREAPQPPAVQFDDAGGQAVEEDAVVGNEDERAGKAQQVRFEPLDGTDVEMVGRFVQEQQFRVADQRLRQGHPALPAAGKRADPCRGVELQPRQHGLHLCVQAPAVLVLQLRLQFVQPRHQRRGFGALRGGQLRGGAVVVGHDITHRAQGAGECLLDGVVGVEHRLLRHQRQAQRVGAVHRAGVGQQVAGQQLEERRFAAAVASDQGEPLAGFDLQRRLVQQRHAVEGQRHLFKGKNGHRVSRRSEIR